MKTGPDQSLGPCPGGRARSAGPLLFFVEAVVVASVVSAVCDQVSQVAPVQQVDAIDEVHQRDPVHQVDHKDEFANWTFRF